MHIYCYCINNLFKKNLQQTTLKKDYAGTTRIYGIFRSSVFKKTSRIVVSYYFQTGHNIYYSNLYNRTVITNSETAKYQYNSISRTTIYPSLRRGRTKVLCCSPSSKNPLHQRCKNYFRKINTYTYGVKGVSCFRKTNTLGFDNARESISKGTTINGKYFSQRTTTNGKLNRSLVVGNTQASSYSYLFTKTNDSFSMFWNQCFDKTQLKLFVIWFLKTYGENQTVLLLEKLKDAGFKYASQAGVSISIDDLKIPSSKAILISQAENQILEASFQYQRGSITGVERFQKLIDTWHRTSELLKQEVIRHFEETDIFNPVYMMAFSGARGNVSQVRQLVGMRGLMANPQGQIIDFPIRSNFREGLTLTEYLISSYGARKGIVDTALRTANAGYLTRRLVDVAQHIIVAQFDCQTNRGIGVMDLKEGNKTLYSLQNRLVGRVLAKDVSFKGTLIANRNQEISLKLASQLSQIFSKIYIRSPLTCETKKLVCQLCYGWSLSQGKLVSIGEAVGIIAAQSIGEPGTQLTMRTFHTGGVFSGDLTDQIIAPFDGILIYSAPIAGTVIRMPDGKMAFLTKTEGSFVLKQNVPLSGKAGKADSQELDKHQQQNFFYKIPAYTVLFLRNQETFEHKQILAQISLFSKQRKQRDDEEQNIQSNLEGEVFHGHMQIDEQSNEYDEKKRESSAWGYVWILGGKIYKSPLSSFLFTKTGDFVNTFSSINQIDWFLSDSSYLEISPVINSQIKPKKQCSVSFFCSPSLTPKVLLPSYYTQGSSKQGKRKENFKLTLQNAQLEKKSIQNTSFLIKAEEKLHNSARNTIVTKHWKQTQIFSSKKSIINVNSQSDKKLDSKKAWEKLVFWQKKRNFSSSKILFSSSSNFSSSIAQNADVKRLKLQKEDKLAVRRKKRNNRFTNYGYSNYTKKYPKIKSYNPMTVEKLNQFLFIKKSLFYLDIDKIHYRKMGYFLTFFTTQQSTYLPGVALLTPSVLVKAKQALFSIKERSAPNGQSYQIGLAFANVSKSDSFFKPRSEEKCSFYLPSSLDSKHIDVALRRTLPQEDCVSKETLVLPKKQKRDSFSLTPIKGVMKSNFLLGSFFSKYQTKLGGFFCFFLVKNSPDQSLNRPNFFNYSKNLIINDYGNTQILKSDRNYIVPYFYLRSFSTYLRKKEIDIVYQKSKLEKMILNVQEKTYAKINKRWPNKNSQLWNSNTSLLKSLSARMSFSSSKKQSIKNQLYNVQRSELVYMKAEKDRFDQKKHLNLCLKGDDFAGRVLYFPQRSQDYEFYNFNLPKNFFLKIDSSIKSSVSYIGRNKIPSLISSIDQIKDRYEEVETKKRWKKEVDNYWIKNWKGLIRASDSGSTVRNKDVNYQSDDSLLVSKKVFFGRTNVPLSKDLLLRRTLTPSVPQVLGKNPQNDLSTFYQINRQGSSSEGSSKGRFVNMSTNNNFIYNSNFLKLSEAEDIVSKSEHFRSNQVLKKPIVLPSSFLINNPFKRKYSLFLQSKIINYFKNKTQKKRMHPFQVKISNYSISPIIRKVRYLLNSEQIASYLNVNKFSKLGKSNQNKYRCYFLVLENIFNGYSDSKDLITMGCLQSKSKKMEEVKKNDQVVTFCEELQKRVISNNNCQLLLPHLLIILETYQSQIQVNKGWIYKPVTPLEFDSNSYCFWVQAGQLLIDDIIFDKHITYVEALIINRVNSADTDRYNIYNYNGGQSDKTSFSLTSLLPEVGEKIGSTKEELTKKASPLKKNTEVGLKNVSTKIRTSFLRKMEQKKLLENLTWIRNRKSRYHPFIADSFALPFIETTNLILGIQKVTQYYLPKIQNLKNQFYKLKKSSFANASCITFKNYQSFFLNKQKKTEKLLPKFPNIDLHIQSTLNSLNKGSIFVETGTDNHFNSNGIAPNTNSSFPLLFEHHRKQKKLITFIPQQQKWRLNTKLNNRLKKENDKAIFTAYTQIQRQKSFNPIFYSSKCLNIFPIEIRYVTSSTFSYPFQIPFFQFNSLKNIDLSLSSFFNHNAKNILNSRLPLWIYLLSKLNHKSSSSSPPDLTSHSNTSFVTFPCVRKGNKQPLVSPKKIEGTLVLPTLVLPTLVLPTLVLPIGISSKYLWNKEGDSENNKGLPSLTPKVLLATLGKSLTFEGKEKQEEALHNNNYGSFVNAKFSPFWLYSLSSLLSLPSLSFHIGQKFHYFLNSRIFASYFWRHTPDKDTLSDLLFEYKRSQTITKSGLFSPIYPYVKNQLFLNEKNRIQTGFRFACTFFLSPYKGEILDSSLPNWLSLSYEKQTSKQQLILTQEDLVSFLFSQKNNNNNYYNSSSSVKSIIYNHKSVKNLENENLSSTLLPDTVLFSRGTLVSPKQHVACLPNTFGVRESNSNNIVEKQVTLQKDPIIIRVVLPDQQKTFKVTNLKIGLSSQENRSSIYLGQFVFYGDSLEPTTAIDETGLIVHINRSKVTIRKGQPIFVSPKTILHQYHGDFVQKKESVVTLAYQRIKTGDIVQGIPKIEQIFEARTTKQGRLFRDSLPHMLENLFLRYKYKLSQEKAVRQSFYKIRQIIVDGVQRVYRSQGVSIADKHIEVIVKEMTSKVRIVNRGVTAFFPGELVDLDLVEHLNTKFIKKIKYEPVVLGISKASLSSDSFLASASFQQTIKVLSRAAIYKKQDFLRGLKENVIVGNLIPAGTGFLTFLDDK